MKTFSLKVTRQGGVLRDLTAGFLPSGGRNAQELAEFAMRIAMVELISLETLGQETSHSSPYRFTHLRWRRELPEQEQERYHPPADLVDGDVLDPLGTDLVCVSRLHHISTGLWPCDGGVLRLTYGLLVGRTRLYIGDDQVWLGDRTTRRQHDHYPKQDSDQYLTHVSCPLRCAALRQHR